MTNAEPQAPLTSCVDHPTRAGATACLRCGRFVCDWCIKLAPSWAPGHCGACQQVIRRPVSTSEPTSGMRAVTLILGLHALLAFMILVSVQPDPSTGRADQVFVFGGCVLVIAANVAALVQWHLQWPRAVPAVQGALALSLAPPMAVMATALPEWPVLALTPSP